MAVGDIQSPPLYPPRLFSHLPLLLQVTDGVYRVNNSHDDIKGSARSLLLIQS